VKLPELLRGASLAKLPDDSMQLLLLKKMKKLGVDLDKNLHII
jgi:hypothetical protein